MDAEFPQLPMPAEQRGAIRERIHKLELWLVAHGRDVDLEQAHLSDGSRERAYWHYGYLCALRDVLKLIDSPAAH